MGQLLLSRASQQGLSSGGSTRSQKAASMVVCQAQSVVAGAQTVSDGISARSAGPCPPYQADEQFPVGDIVNLSPRAGCLKQARPGSMSGMWKRSMVWLLRHRQTKGPETDRPHLPHRATSRLHS